MKITTRSAVAALAFMLCGSGSLFAQTTSSSITPVLPTTPDHQAAPGPEYRQVEHTGTDALAYEIPASEPTSDYLDGNTLQVMTWDEGNQVTVSWDVFDDMVSSTSGPNIPLATPPGAIPAKGSFQFSTAPNPVSGLGPDPDIVLAYDPRSGDIYANLVFVSGDFVQYQVYRWDWVAHTFSLVNQQQLGSTDYTHSYPNIDANKNGLVAVTWQQDITTNVTITVTSNNNYFPTYTIPQTIKFSRSVLAGGDITGNFRNCYKNPTNGTLGMFVLDPPTGLFEQTLHPDVAISEGDESNTVISSTFIRHFVDGKNLFSIHNKVNVIQTRYDRCGAHEEPHSGQDPLVTLEPLPDGRYEWDYSNNDIIGTPRIAAPPISVSEDPDRAYDVEVAVDRTVGSCGAPQYAIWNFGKSLGQFRKEYTLISPAGDPNLILSIDPAISFSVLVPNRSQSLRRAGYTISWTGGPGYDKSEEIDVWAVSLSDGAFSNGASGPNAQPSGYNRVNYNGPGQQDHASIAGRHLIGNCFGRPGMSDDEIAEAIAAGATPGGCQPYVHLFADKALSQASYRRTSDVAGSGIAYRSAPANQTSVLQAYPNPSDGLVTIRLNLHAAEKVRRLVVLDSQGRQVAELNAAAASEGLVEWKPATKMPAGLYLVRVETTERTTSVNVVRN